MKTKHFLNNKIRRIDQFRKHDSLVLTYDDVKGYVTGGAIGLGVPAYLLFHEGDVLSTLDVWILKEIRHLSPPRIRTLSDYQPPIRTFDCITSLDDTHGIMMENMCLIPTVVRVERGYKLGFYEYDQAHAFEHAIGRDSDPKRRFIKMTELE